MTPAITGPPTLPALPAPAQAQVTAPTQQPAQAKRPVGRPPKGQERPKVSEQYKGPVTRARTKQSLTAPAHGNISPVSEVFQKFLDDATVRQKLVDTCYKNLCVLKPHVKRGPPTEPIIYYGDGGLSRDEFGIPVTRETLKHPSYLRRRAFFSRLKPDTRNRILTGDPELVFDPIFYEYVLSFPRLQGVANLAGHLQIPPGPPLLQNPWTTTGHRPMGTRLAVVHPHSLHLPIFLRLGLPAHPPRLVRNYPQTEPLRLRMKMTFCTWVPHPTLLLLGFREGLRMPRSRRNNHPHLQPHLRFNNHQSSFNPG